MSTQIQLKRIYSCFTRNVIIFVPLHPVRFVRSERLPPAHTFPMNSTSLFTFVRKFAEWRTACGTHRPKCTHAPHARYRACNKLFHVWRSARALECTRKLISPIWFMVLTGRRVVHVARNLYAKWRSFHEFLSLHSQTTQILLCTSSCCSCHAS